MATMTGQVQDQEATRLETVPAVPLAMQIWQHRFHRYEVKVLWASQGKVGFTSCWKCKSCENRCEPGRADLTEFVTEYAYVRAFG